MEIGQEKMAEKIYIKDVAAHEGEEIIIEGWLYNKRSSGKLRFLLLRDGTETIQCVVFKGDVSEESFAIADVMQQESSCRIKGIVAKDERSPIGFEIQVKEVQIIQYSEEYPITKK